MIKTTFFSLAAAAAMTTLSSATILNLAGDAMPRTPGGDFIPNGLVRIGTLNGDPVDAMVASIEAQFAEFGTSAITAPPSFTPNVFAGSTSRNDGNFDDQQVYIWVFDKPTVAESDFHALFTVNDPDNPGEGDGWRFETHIGNGTDSRTLTINAATLANADLSVTTDASVDGAFLNLQRIPEPSGALLAGFAGMVLMLRRRR